MNIIIEKAQESDIDALSRFYDEVNDYLASHINYPEWKRGIYPARDTAENAVLEGTAYAARENGRIIGSFILRQVPENGYEKADWHFPSDYDNIIVVYTLAVHPDYSGKGVGRQLVDFIADYGRENGMKAVRLDVYEKMSRQSVCTRNAVSSILILWIWGMGSTGWTGLHCFRSFYEK